MNLNLSQIERENALWRKITKALEAELAQCHKKNEGDLDPTRTARLRGRIRLLNELLAPAESRGQAGVTGDTDD